MLEYQVKSADDSNALFRVIYKEAAPIFVNAEGKIVQPVQEKS